MKIQSGPLLQWSRPLIPGERSSSDFREKSSHKRIAWLCGRVDLCGHGWIERVEATACIGRDCPLSSYLVQIPTMWRQAPITAAIVIAAGLTHHSKMSGIEHGVHKVAEVIFGCLVGLLVSLLMAKVWPVAEPEIDHDRTHAAWTRRRGHRTKELFAAVHKSAIGTKRT